MELIHIYTKNIRPSHIDHDLSFPTAILRALVIPEGSNKIFFEAADDSGSQWRFCISTRSSGLYLKPVLLRSSWHPFVEQKGLKTGDRVTFYRFRDDNDDVKFGVRAQRIITLMGQDVWADL